MDKLITEFYTAFKNLDAEAMVACYADTIVFEDPAFGVLEGERAKNMWRMLCKNTTDLKIDFSNIQTNQNSGSVEWQADYSFSRTGRIVHNEIKASFEFKDGKIIKHTDNFDLHTWAKQALGFKGLVLGGTKIFQKKFITQTHKLLDKFEKTR